MASLHVIYDPLGEMQFAWSGPPDQKDRPLAARLDVPVGLDGVDIYAIARKLAELLLEQIG